MELWGCYYGMFTNVYSISSFPVYVCLFVELYDVANGIHVHESSFECGEKYHWFIFYDCPKCISNLVHIRRGNYVIASNQLKGLLIRMMSGNFFQNRE